MAGSIVLTTGGGNGAPLSVQIAVHNLLLAGQLVDPVYGGGSSGLYLDLTPTIYAAPADVGSGNGSSEANAMDMATAITVAAPDDIIGQLPGVYSKAPITASRSVPAWNPTNSGTSGNPIRIVAKYPAALFQGSPELWSEMRSGHSGAVGTGNPAFGCFERSHVHWLGQYASDENGHSVSANDTGPVVLWDSTACYVRYCVIRGRGAAYAGDDTLYRGVTLEGGGGSHWVSHNRVSNFYAVAFGDSSANGAAIMVVEAGASIVEHNELSDCGAGYFCKRNGPNPGTLNVRYNYIHDTSGPGARFGTTNANGSTAHSAYCYQNLMVDCGGAGWAADESSSGTGDAANVYFVNNTGARCRWGYGNIVSPASLNNYKHWNNIISSPTDAAMYFEGMSLATLLTLTEADFDSEHNGYHDCPEFWINDAPNTRSLAYWKATLGQDSASPAAITTDPEFVDAVGGDFRLGGSSPYLTHGRDILGLAGAPDITRAIPAGCYLTGDEYIGIG